MLHKIAIVGSRSFKHLELVEKYIYNIIYLDTIYWDMNPDWNPDDDASPELLPKVEIVSGAGGDVDCHAVKMAIKYGIPYKEFPAAWRIDGVYNHSAGIERNKLIVDYSDCVVAFLDLSKNYKNSGTLSTCHFAALAGLPVKIITGIDNF